MFDSFSLNPSFPSLSEQADERLKASFQMLSEIKQTLLGTDVNSIADNLLLLIRQANSSINASLLDMQLLQILMVPDISVQMRVLSAISILLPSDSISIPFLPGYFKLLLTIPELVPHVLRCINAVLNIEIFENLQETLDELAIIGPEIARRNCLFIFYKAYTLEPNNSEFLMKHIRRALFDPVLRNHAFTILAEVVLVEPFLVEPLLPFLLPEIQDADYFSFAKLLQIFSFFTDDEIFAPQLEGELLQVLQKNKQLRYLIEVSRLLIKMTKSQALLQEVQQRLERAILINRNQNYTLEIVNILSKLGSRISLSREVYGFLLSSQDYNIVSTALKLEGKPSVSEEIIKVVNDIVVAMSSTPSPHLAAAAMQLVPHHGEWFITIIFEIYNMHVTSAFDVLADAILDVSDATTQKYIIAEAKKQMNELPDDRFGIAIAETIAKVSDDTEDFFVLLPSNVAYKSPEFQAAMIGCIFEFWSRLNFEIDTSMINRLMLMSFSNHREVRQRALELISLIKL